MNKPKFRAYLKSINKVLPVCELSFRDNDDLPIGVDGYEMWYRTDEVILMQYSDYHDEENLDEIWESDLLEIESPKGKFIAEVVKCYGTFGVVAVKGDITDYFPDHWNDNFMPLINLYWDGNCVDGCLPKSKRLGSKYENPELLNEVE